MIFINTIGVIIFPVLRRTERIKLASIYLTMRDLLMALLIGVLVFYYPLKTILSVWLPQYADSLAYMALAFPMFTYEGKMALLINTYLKALLKEKLILRVNTISMMLSLILTFIATQLINNLEIAMLNIVILLAFRSALAEFFVAKELNIEIKKDIVLETIMTIIFIITGWYVNSWVVMALYALSYTIYLLIKKNNIKQSISSIRILLKG